MNVTRLDDYRAEDVVTMFRDALIRAQAGHVRGAAIILKIGNKAHRIGFAGDYWEDPAQVLGPINRMAYKVNQLISARNEEPDTSTMPL